ncbi:hypothetical protein BGX23_001727 [Mortierella sp. AD031]|nr:hypothetical protein BGX23_001727 [Mortierella sp. AD031]
MVNPYSPDLTRYCRSNTDIRFNIVPRAHLYLSKYISKTDNKAEGSLDGTAFVSNKMSMPEL